MPSPPRPLPPLRPAQEQKSAEVDEVRNERKISARSDRLAFRKMARGVVDVVAKLDAADRGLGRASGSAPPSPREMTDAGRHGGQVRRVCDRAPRPGGAAPRARRWGHAGNAERPSGGAVAAAAVAGALDGWGGGCRCGGVRGRGAWRNGGAECGARGGSGGWGGEGEGRRGHGGQRGQRRGVR